MGENAETMKFTVAALLVAAVAALQPNRVDETSVEFLSVSEMVTAESPKGNVTIYGDMNVQGSLRTTSIQSSNLTVDGSLNVNADLKASKLKVDNLHADSIETMRLSSPSGAIMVDADLTISSISTDTVAASFLEVGGAKQWALVFHEDFQEKVSGWTPVKVSSCGGEDKFLGGHCNFAADTASKVFKNLPAHTQVRMTASFHFLDQWDGEQAFASIDGKNVWADSSKSNVCGAAHPDRKFAAPIDVTMQHTGDNVEVKFGTTMDSSTDSCQQSWGVDDVTIYVK